MSRAHFTYVTTHSPTLPSLYLRHSSFSNTSVASPTSQFILQPFFRFSYITYSLLNTPGLPPMPAACVFRQISTLLVCSSLCQNVVLLRQFYTRKEMQITGSQVRVDDGGWPNTSQRKLFRSLFVAAAVCGRAISWRRTIPEDNIPRCLFWIKESNYSTYFTFGGRDYSLGHVYCITACSEMTNAMCRDWRAY